MLAPGLAARVMAEMACRPGGRNPPQPWELGTGAQSREIEYLPGQYAQAWGEVGPLVVAMHGWRGRPGQFRPLAAPLIARGCRLMALDAPGHGRSQGKRASPVILGQWLQEAAAILGPVHAVVGHSLGGAAIGAALAGGLKVPRVALIASPSRVSRLPLRFAAELGLSPRVIERLPTLLDAHSRRPSAELDLLSSLPNSGAAALAVHDQGDEMIPYVESEQLAAAMPSLQLFTTRGLGHRDLLANAEVISVLAEFLGQPG